VPLIAASAPRTGNPPEATVPPIGTRGCKSGGNGRLTPYQALPPGGSQGSRPALCRYSGTMSGAPSRAASAVRSSGWRWDSRSASTRFS
jgi:hypothetical protein